MAVKADKHQSLGHLFKEEANRDHFSNFITEDFTAYCKRKRMDKVYGNNAEIQALSDIFNQPIHIYSYSSDRINILHSTSNSDMPPIRLSYHDGNHYNSLVDPQQPAIVAGLGLNSLQAIEGEKVSSESNGKALEGVNQDNGNMESYEPVGDAPVMVKTERAAEINGIKSKSLEEEKAEDAKQACEDVEMKTPKIEVMPVKTVKLETADEISEGNKLVEIPVADKKPEALETEKNEEQKPVLDAERKKEEPETSEMKKIEEQKPDSDVEKNKEKEKLFETVKVGTLEKNLETPDTEKTEELKPASNTEETKTEEKLTEKTQIETSDNVEDKHVLEPPSNEEPSDEKCNGESVKEPETPNMISKQQESASDAEKLTVEEEKTKE